MRRHLILSALLLWGLWLWLVGADPAPIQQPFTVAIAPNQTLTGRLYLPANTTAPVPALLLCHGVNSSKDTLAPLAQALARHQIAAVVFDFGGYGQSYRRPMTRVPIGKTLTPYGNGCVNSLSSVRWGLAVTPWEVLPLWNWRKATQI